MSGKSDRRIRKEVNHLMRNNQAVADNLIKELLNAPFKYRFLFAMKLIFWRKKKNERN